MTHKTIVLLPTYNERENVGLIVPEIFARYPDLRIVVIDDSSPDGTGRLVQEMMTHYAGLSLLSRPKKEGLGVAYKHGIRHVLEMEGATRIIMMDADGSHDVAYIGHLLAESHTYDLVIGSRYVRGGGIEGWEGWRYALSKYGNLYARILTGLPIRDLTAGFYCIRRSVLVRMDFEAMKSSGYAFQIDIKFHSVRDLGASVIEIPIVFKRRREGESKISRHIIREGLLAPLSLLLRRIFNS